MTSPAPQPPPQPSPDGKWWWTGTTWTPHPQQVELQADAGAQVLKVVHRLTPEGVERLPSGFRTRCTCGWTHSVVGSEADARRAYHVHQFGPESIQVTPATTPRYSQQPASAKRPVSAWKIALVLTPVLLLISQCGGDADPGGEYVECLDSAARVLNETGFDISSGC